MSHVDDGTLHAYLDGQLSAIETARLEQHLTDCAACRARLEAQRTLITRAGRLLALATPPDGVAPAWPPRPAAPLWWRLRFPLAWAATTVVMLGVAWYVYGLRRGRAERQQTDQAAGRTVAVAPPVRASEPKRAAATERAAPGNAPAPSAGGAPESVLGQAKPAAPARAPAPAPAPAALALRRDAADTWQEIGWDDAATMLGRPPAAIPGLPIHRLARPRTGEPVVVIEQRLDSGTVVRLYERRSAAAADSLAREERLRAAADVDITAAGRTAAHLGRDVGPLHVEIEGPLAADSLSRLLVRVK